MLVAVVYTSNVVNLVPDPDSYQESSPLPPQKFTYICFPDNPFSTSKFAACEDLEDGDEAPKEGVEVRPGNLTP